MHDDDPYMVWYRCITRRYISRVACTFDFVSGHLVQICNASLEGSHIGTLARQALAALHEQDRFARVPPSQPDVHEHAEAEPSDVVDSEAHIERDFTSIPDIRSMLIDWWQTLICMEDFGNAMTEQDEEGVIHLEEGVSHTAAGALHSGDGLTLSLERVPAFTKTVTHSEERGSHADEKHFRTTHASHEEVPVSAVTQSEEGGTQSRDGIPLSTERGRHCGERGSHVDQRVLPIVPMDPVPHMRKRDRHQATEGDVTQVAKPPRRKERVPAFTEIVTHSEERSSHADEQHFRTTHASHEEVPVSAITQSEEGGTQSEDGIPLSTKRVTHYGEGGSHVDE